MAGKERNELRLWFDHGLGDCVHFAHVLQLYQRRGYETQVHYEENKKLIWRAAQAQWIPLEGARYVEFGYPSQFGSLSESELLANKIAHNLDLSPLLRVAPKEALWRELAEVRLSVRGLVPEASRTAARRFVAGLPRPIVLLHTHGTNFATQKNIPAPTCISLYERLIASGAGLVLLDWDDRVPRYAHAACRHLYRDWGHAELEDLAALYEEADLLIGVDSGPYHFAALTDIPAIGIWRHHHPNHCSLPRPRTVNLVSGEFHKHWHANRHAWNLIEYPGEEPTAEFIARIAQCALAGPSLFRRDQSGRELQLEVLMSSSADRTLSWRRAFSELTRCAAEPTIVETGCIRSVEDWSAGYSTYLFALYLAGEGAGILHSVDNSQTHLDLARAVTEGVTDRVAFHCSDSIAWLGRFSAPIDLLYLDSLDVEEPGHPEHALAELEAAKPSLHAQSLVLVDDTGWDGGWTGKGKLVVPRLVEQGWKVLAATRQVLLARR
ncbi:MAG: class I SAM-dependent methyltransferase [Betaproteobacteria bacterium]|nr:class I SAM-dependent methyltransferase [Betaproteobacteria bacterium]MBI2288783.1 class I SAM-dependent methyltransferase [Betaproteobacteria bacterium]MBI3054336.1 class I SAM-dependent methyltransferase [Betaproteobacteria bacterium]